MYEGCRHVGDVWTYRPAAHKNAWRGKGRTVAIGPRGRALLAECIDKLPGWAGVNDDAHGWYCRAKTALSLRPWEIPAPPLLDEQEGE